MLCVIEMPSTEFTLGIWFEGVNYPLSDITARCYVSRVELVRSSWVFDKDVPL